MSVPESLLESIARLEPLPATLQRLMSALGQDNLELGDLVDIVEHDQAVVSNILRAANSGFYGGRRRISKIRDAMVRLGRGGLMDTILGAHVRRVLAGGPDHPAENELWLHGAVASLAVREITRTCAQASIPAEASLAALVHDLGRLIMWRYLEAGDGPPQADGDVLTDERARYGCDHAEVGALVAGHWGFPEAVTDAIARHHEAPLSDPGPLMDAVVVADAVVKSIGLNAGRDGEAGSEVDPGSLQRLGLTWEGFCRICVGMAPQVAELKDQYGMDT